MHNSRPHRPHSRSKRHKYSSRRAPLVVANLQLRLAILNQQTDDDDDDDEEEEEDDGQRGLLLSVPHEVVPSRVAAVAPAAVAPGASTPQESVQPGDGMHAAPELERQHHTQQEWKAEQQQQQLPSTLQEVVVVLDSLPATACEEQTAGDPSAAESDEQQTAGRLVPDQQQQHAYQSVLTQGMLGKEAAYNCCREVGAAAGDSTLGLRMQQQLQYPLLQEPHTHQADSCNEVAALAACGRGVSHIDTIQHQQHHNSPAKAALGGSSRTCAYAAAEAVEAFTATRQLEQQLKADDPLQLAVGGSMFDSHSCCATACGTHAAAAAAAAAAAVSYIKYTTPVNQQRVLAPCKRAAAACGLETGCSGDADHEQLTALVRSARKRPHLTPFVTTLDASCGVKISEAAGAAGFLPGTATVNAANAPDSNSDNDYAEIREMLRNARKRIHFTQSETGGPVAAAAAAQSARAAPAAASTGAVHLKVMRAMDTPKTSRGLQLVPSVQQQQQGHPVLQPQVTGVKHDRSAKVASANKQALSLKASGRELLQLNKHCQLRQPASKKEQQLHQAQQQQQQLWQDAVQMTVVVSSPTAVALQQQQFPAAGAVAGSSPAMHIVSAAEMLKLEAQQQPRTNRLAASRGDPGIVQLHKQPPPPTPPQQQQHAQVDAAQVDAAKQPHKRNDHVGQQQSYQPSHMPPLEQYRKQQQLQLEQAPVPTICYPVCQELRPSGHHAADVSAMQQPKLQPYNTQQQLVQRLPPTAGVAQTNKRQKALQLPEQQQQHSHACDVCHWQPPQLTGVACQQHLIQGHQQQQQQQQQQQPVLAQTPTNGVKQTAAVIAELAAAQAGPADAAAAALSSAPAADVNSPAHAQPNQATSATPSRASAQLQQQQQQQQRQQCVLRHQQAVQLCPDDLLLSSYLGTELVDRYRSIGCLKHDLYRWQAECLQQPGVVAGHNLVFSAPTSAGKSLVAQILLLQQLQQQPQQVVLVVMPLVELCSEMSNSLEPLLQQLNKEVYRSYGGLHSGGPIRDTTGAIVCTIERANVLVTQMMSEDPLLSSLGLVIVDELHLVGDADRGYLLEVLLTKIRYTSQAAKLALAEQQQEKQQAGIADVTLSLDTQERLEQQQQQQGSSTPTPASRSGSSRQLSSRNSSRHTATSEGGPEPIQIVGMSATLPNVDQIALWLDAQLFVTDFRPVPLHQWVKVGCSIRDINYQHVRDLPSRDQQVEARDPDHVALLTQEVVQTGHSVLIFVAKREDCAKVAAQVTSCISIPERNANTPQADGHTTSAAAQGDRSTDDLPASAATAGARSSCAKVSRADVQQQLRELMCGLKLVGNRDLSELVGLVGAGAGCHHAGLPKEVRELMSRAFSTGCISVLCATTSLAYGVNLPARRVIFKHAYKAYDAPENWLSHTEYMQMSGRAGRAGIDDVGEAILIEDQQGRNHQQLKSLIQGSSVPVCSCLGESGRGMSRALLEVIATGVVASSDDVQRFLDCSLLRFTASDAAADTQAGLKWLHEQHMVRWDAGACSHVATDLGRATAASGLPPDKALMVRKDIDTALRHLCVCDAHILYLATPNWNLDAITPNWRKLYEMCRRAVCDGEQRSDTGQVLQFVGLLGDQALDHIKQQAQRVLTRQKPLSGAELTPDQAAVDAIARRFWGARMLVDIIRETDDATVASTWLPQTSDSGRSKAQVVKELRDRAHGFATMVASLCERLSVSDQRYSLIAALLNSHKQRVYHGVREEILALTEIKHVKGPKARVMFEAGIKTPQDVVTAGVDRLLRLFLKLVKPDTITGAVSESRVSHEKQVAANIVKAARQLLVSKGAGTASADQPAAVAALTRLPAKRSKACNRSSRMPPAPSAAVPVHALTEAVVGQPPADAVTHGQQGEVVHQPQDHSMECLATERVDRQQQEQQPPHKQQGEQQLCNAGYPVLPAVHDQHQHKQGRRSETPKQEQPQQQQRSAVPELADQLNRDFLCGPAPQRAPRQQNEQQPIQCEKEPQTSVTDLAKHPQQQQQQEELPANANRQMKQHQGVVELLPASPGVTYIKDTPGMQQLVATLAAAECWSFSLHLDTTDPVLNPDEAKRQARAARGKGSSNNTSGATKASKETHSSRSVNRSAPAVAADSAGNLRSGARHRGTAASCSDKPWRWAVLGVAFSVADGCAWYVPLSTGDVPEDSAMRSRTTSRLRNMWDGLQAIFGSRELSTGKQAADTEAGSSSSAAAGSCTRVPAVAAAAAACNAGALAAAAATDVSWLSPKPVKVTFALKPQLLLLANPPVESGLEGIQMQGSLVDVRVAAWLLNPDSSNVQESSWTGHHGAMYMTKGLCELLCAPGFGSSADVSAATDGLQGTSDTLEAGQRVAMVHRLFNNILPHVRAAGLLPLLMGIEMPLIKVLANMESMGIAINRQVLADQVPAMLKRMDQLAQQAAAYNRGIKFDLVRNAKGRLSRLLFSTRDAGGLGLQPPLGIKRTSSGCYSTAQDVLAELEGEHPLPGIVLKYRKLSTLHSHLLSRLQHADTTGGAAAVCAAADSRPTRISGEWMQTCSSTGRLSMGDFSLQCIPKAVEYEIELSPEAPGGVRRIQQQQSNIRAGFVAAPGFVLLAADYSQIELRLMAHFSGEQALLDALRQGDPFRAMAAHWLRKPADEVTEADRSSAKQIAYGLIYGMGSGELCKRLGCGELEARAASDDFKNSHPGLMHWVEGVKAACRQHGYLRCLSGRHRLLPGITSSSYESRGRAERRAVNGTCQGSAADIVKGVMVEVMGQLQMQAMDQDCKLLLQIHDELLFEVSQSRLTAAAQLVKCVMESAAEVWGLSVPLPVKLSVGPSWGELQPYAAEGPG